MKQTAHNKSPRNPDARDPFGLGELPLLEPGHDGWAQIQARLSADRQGRRRMRIGAGLAIAASLVLALGVVLRQPSTPINGPAPAQTAQMDQATEAAPLQDLIAMSQILEQRLRQLRDQTSSMPSESAVFVAELEDLVARVDGQLSAQPKSLDLWTQRVNLMLDLEYLFQHQFEREYGRMASL